MAGPAAKDNIVRIELSPAQTEQVRLAAGVEIKAIELSIEELEQRIAPRLAANDNETMLVQ
jgi:hypothetical protein